MEYMEGYQLCYLVLKECEYIYLMKAMVYVNVNYELILMIIKYGVNKKELFQI